MKGICDKGQRIVGLLEDRLQRESAAGADLGGECFERLTSPMYYVAALSARSNQLMFGTIRSLIKNTTFIATSSDRTHVRWTSGNTWRGQEEYSSYLPTHLLGHPMPLDVYSHKYFDRYASASRNSASVVLPVVLDLVSPSSVVDLGCGAGTWLAELRELGVEDVYGVDGGEGSGSMLPPQLFLRHDLCEALSLPRTFDLAMSLEVAEHLPAEAAPILVEALTRLAPVVLFSAAVPYQGGAEHVNEQWPAYWARLFANRGYVVRDVLRRRLWEDERVDWWYAQNTFLYIERSSLGRIPLLSGERDGDVLPLAIVHPRALESAALAHTVDRLSFWQALRLARETFVRAIHRRIRSHGDARPPA